MFNVIDILGILVVVISAIIAFKKGFVKTFFDFISTFIAIVLAFSLCNFGVQLIKENTTIDEWLEEVLNKSLNVSEEKNEEYVLEEDYTTSDNANNNFLTETLENLPQNIKEIVGLEEYKENAKISIIENSIEIILKILSWIIIYVLARLILWLLCLIFNGIMSIPFLKQINNMAGLVLGAVVGLFRIYIFLAFVSFLTSVVTMDSFMELIKNSMIISVMYENNILISLIF